MKDNLFRTSIIFSFALLLGRISGALREWVLSFRFGVSAQADLAVLLLTFPDLITNLLLSGGFNVAFIPLVKGYPPELGKSIFLKLLFFVFIFSSVFISIFIFLPHLWYKIFCPGISLYPNIENPLFFTLLSIPLAMGSCVLTAYLNANNRFFISGLGTMFFNVFVIFSLGICIDQDHLLVYLSWGIFLGTMVRFLSQWMCKPKIGRINIKAKVTLSTKFIKKFLLASFCSSIPLLLPLTVRTVCSFFGYGQISAFNYANKFIEIPLGIFITSIGVVLYPLLCDDDGMMSKIEVKCLQKALLFSCFFLCFGLSLGKPVLQLIYQHGQCSSDDINTIYNVFKCLLFTLPFCAINTIFSTQLNAKNKTQKVFYSNIIAILVFFLFEILAIKIKCNFLIYLSLVLFQSTLSLFLIVFGSWIKIFDKIFVGNTFLIIISSIFCHFFYLRNNSLFCKIVIAFIVVFLFGYIVQLSRKNETIF